MRSSIFRLIIVWAILIGMTLMTYRGAASATTLPILFPLLMLVACAKMVIVIAEYMDVKVVSKPAFSALVIICVCAGLLLVMLHHFSLSYV